MVPKEIEDSRKISVYRRGPLMSFESRRESHFLFWDLPFWAYSTLAGRGKCSFCEWVPFRPSSYGFKYENGDFDLVADRM